MTRAIRFSAAFPFPEERERSRVIVTFTLSGAGHKFAVDALADEVNAYGVIVRPGDMSCSPGVSPSCS
jgi:hypothetical protein